MTQDKRQSIKITLLGNVLHFQTPAGGFDFDPSGCTDEVEMAATIKGYKEKISNKAAMPAGTSWNVKLAAMREVAERLAAGGAWNERAAAAGLNRACLFAAIATVRQVAPEKVAAKFQGYEDKVLQTFLTHRDIAAEYSRLTAPQDSSAADGMLAELE